MQFIFYVLFICILIRYLMYRRQIQGICRQLEFLQQEATNKRLQTDLSSQDIIKLTVQINNLLDMQERKEMDVQKRENHLKETMANISHDIHTPLTSMKGFFELYLREQDEEQRKYYERIILNRMEDTQLLLEELFTYTKLQNASYELVLEEYNFTRAVMNCLFDFYEQWQETQITPKLEIYEVPAMVVCNESAVKRILTNILRNATIHGEGTIQITYLVQDGQVIFRCSNPVTAQNEPDPEQVFDRFYKADAARSQSSNGLGLAIAMELTHRMEGDIQAAMEDGIFTIETRFTMIF
ncbi:MAG: HAMP domain-containing histidine kinase [Lachnospiraceae bacterium]|nr:HAMP domain-containing histidine kinase [Lachnospiraceae bacterium]